MISYFNMDTSSSVFLSSIVMLYGQSFYIIMYKFLFTKLNATSCEAIFTHISTT